jgi:hypothetical protein
MKLEVLQRRLSESQRNLGSTRHITQDYVDNSQKKVLKSDRKLMEAQSKLENFLRSNTDNRAQDEVNGVDGATPTLDNEEMVETAKDDKEFQEFMKVVST